MVRMLVALLEYAAARDFDLPPPLVDGKAPLPKAAPRRNNSDLLPSLEEQLAPEVPPTPDPARGALHFSTTVFNLWVQWKSHGNCYRR